jgi:hypothetical protein
MTVPQHLKGKGGQDISRKLSDNAFWLGLPDDLIELLAALDRTKDPKLLLPYLKVPKSALPHFADLFDRHRLKSRSRRTPSYLPTENIVRLMLARDHVKGRARGISREAAIESAARRYRCPPQRLTPSPRWQASII